MENLEQRRIECGWLDLCVLVRFLISILSVIRSLLDQVYALERSLLQLKAICGSAQTKDLPFPEIFF